MMSNKWRIILLLVALGSSAVLFSSMPISELDSGWGHNVVRNWDSVGFFRLGGQLVTNPGGVPPDGHLDIYSGHRPYSLFFPFVIGKVTGGFGADGVGFYLVLSAAVALAASYLLGNRAAGLMGGLLVLMCPGYVRMTVGLDTLTLPVLLGLPFLAPVCKRLHDPRPIGFGLAALMALTVATYAVLNWTTAFVFLIVGLYLIARLGIFNRRFILFTLTATVVTVAVALVSIASKAGGGGSGGMSLFYNSYLWGGGGYGGFPMNWKTAVVRLSAASLLGLLPLLGFSGWVLLRARKAGDLSLKYLMPFAGAAFCVVGMRNYFAHHPWMASSVLIVGLVFSLALILPQLEAGPAEPGYRELLWVMGATAYCYLIVATFSVNSADADRLITLVKQHTPRNGTIILSRTVDTSGFHQLERFNDQFDRTVILPADGPAKEPDGSGSDRTFFLSNETVSALGEPVAQTHDRKGLLTGAISAGLDWYRTHISKRSAADRLSLSETYYLYRYSPGIAPRPSLRLETRSISRAVAFSTKPTLRKAHRDRTRHPRPRGRGARGRTSVPARRRECGQPLCVRQLAQCEFETRSRLAVW